MSDRPIIFSAPMVRALLDGRKTQTRRMLKPWRGMQAEWLTGDMLKAAKPGPFCELDGNLGIQFYHPLAGTVQSYGKVAETSPLTWVRLPYAPGDRLWVREAWGHDGASLDEVRRGVESDGMSYGPYYAADADWFNNATVRRCSPIHMPRWASRLTLAVTDVRVQRLWSISEADALAEGCNASTIIQYSGQERFRDVWRSIHGHDAWAANPWVCALTFTVEQRNIDAKRSIPNE